MSSVPILPGTSPYDWRILRTGISDRDHIILWHGCTGNDSASIVASGVDPGYGQPDTDFGQGFYTTTLRRQAREWAWLRYYSLPVAQQGGGNNPVTLRFRVERAKLASLETLCFVRGDYYHQDYWSLVFHCRSSIRVNPATGTPAKVNNHKHNSHIRPDRRGWYDLVAGPAADKWRQRVAMKDADQFSFHTADAAQILNDLIYSGDRDKFRLEPVP